MLRIKAIPHPRFFLFLALLFCSIAGTSGFMKPEEAVVAGFNIAALGFIAASIPLFLRDQPDDLRRRGARDDRGRVFLLLSSAIVLALIRGQSATWCSGAPDRAGTIMIPVSGAF